MSIVYFESVSPARLVELAGIFLQFGAPLLIAWALLSALRRSLRRQENLQKQRLKLDLFDRRYEFLSLTRAITANSLQHEGRYFEKVQKDYPKFPQYKLLFPEPIAKDADELVRLCDELYVSSQNVRALPVGNPETTVERKKNDGLKQEIQARMARLQQDIERFLRIEWAG